MAVAAVRTPDEEPEKKAALGMESMTAAEMEMAERHAGQSLATLGEERFPQVKLLGSLGWVLHRRTDPKMTFDAYMSSRKLKDINVELGLAEDEQADEGKDDGGSTSSS